jgi:hypothetical protein
VELVRPVSQEDTKVRYMPVQQNIPDPNVIMTFYGKAAKQILTTGAPDSTETPYGVSTGTAEGPFADCDPLGTEMADKKIGRLSGQVPLGSGIEADVSGVIHARLSRTPCPRPNPENLGAIITSAVVAFRPRPLLQEMPLALLRIRPLRSLRDR